MNVQFSKWFIRNLTESILVPIFVSHPTHNNGVSCAIFRRISLFEIERRTLREPWKTLTCKI